MRQASREWGGGAVVAEHLRKRRAEIEGAILTRVYAVSEPPSTGGPEYTEILLAQARLAARSGVNLDTVLRRYFAGYTLLEDFMVEEAERTELLGPAALKRLLRSQASIVDRLLAAVSDAYTEEARRRPDGPDRRRAERIERLLDGEALEVSGLGYGFEGHHLGIVASGPGVQEAIEALAKRLGGRVLTVPREDGILWAWLGSRRRLRRDALERDLPRRLPPGQFMAIGEPGEGLSGWRLTHRQARAALSVALRGGGSVVCYAEVALLASALQDDLLVASLRQAYLEPLRGERDGGGAARETLRAPLASCGVELSVAVCLNQLGEPAG